MSLPIPAGTYDIDPVHSQVGFAITHLGISVVRGTFDNFSGSLTVGADLAQTSVVIEAEMASINSGNGMRDEHVHGADFLDVENHPRMSYRSTSITESDAGYALTGELTIKGVTVPVTFDTSYNGSEVFPVDGSTHFGFSATTTISRTAFDMGYGVPMLSDEVTLQLETQFVQPANRA